MNKYRLFADSESSGYSISNIFYAESYVDAWRRALEYISVVIGMKFTGPKEAWTPIMPKDLRIKLTDITEGNSNTDLDYDKVNVEAPDDAKKVDLDIQELNPGTFMVAIFNRDPADVKVDDLILYTDVDLACCKDVHTNNCATAAREAVKYFNSLDFCEVPNRYTYGVFREVIVNKCMRRLKVAYIDTAIVRPANMNEV